MTKKKNNAQFDGLLRRQAEKIAHESAVPALEKSLPEEVQTLLHELRVHQIELKMQNDELRQSQKNLEKLRAMYFDLYNFAPVGYLTKNDNGQILQANFSFASLVGAELNSLINCPFSQFIYREDQDVYYHWRKQIFATGVPQVCELRLQKKNGTPFWIHMEAKLALGENGETVVRVAISDITERKQAEDVMRESEERLRELIQDTNVMIMTVNSQGKITFMNEYGLSFFGYDGEELVGKSELETIQPEYESSGRSLIKSFEDTQANPQLYQRYTHENITKERRRVWVDWTIRGVEDKETSELRLVCVGVDVTATKTAEQERLRQHTRNKMRDILSDGINQRTSQNEMLGQLRQMGLTLEPPFALCLLAIPDEYMPEIGPAVEHMERQSHIDQLIDFLQGSNIGAAWQTPVGVAVIQTLPEARILPISVGNAKMAGSELAKVVSRYWPGKKIIIGVASSSDEVKELTDLFKQAQAAVQYGSILAPGKSVHHWQDLGYFQFIVKDLHSTQAREFIQIHLGLLLNKKKKVNVEEELTTLQSIISGDSLQLMAGRFHVHKQTIVFRKKKLEEQLGIDLDDLVVRMNLAIALKLLSLKS